MVLETYSEKGKYGKFGLRLKSVYTEVAIGEKNLPRKREAILLKAKYDEIMALHRFVWVTRLNKNLASHLLNI